MNLQFKAIAVLCLGFASFAIAQQSQDGLKRRLLTQAQSISPNDYAFTRTVRIEQTSNGKVEEKVTIEKFDPSKSIETRWILVSVDGAPPSPEALSHYQKDSPKRRVPGYYRLAGYLGALATGSTDSRGRMLLRFAPLPPETVKVLGSDVSPNATAEASVGEVNGVPFVEQVRITVKPMRIKLIAKLATYETIARYRVGPEGKPLLMEQTGNMSGSGLGQEGTVHSVTSYSDYRAVGK